MTPDTMAKKWGEGGTETESSVADSVSRALSWGEAAGEQSGVGAALGI